MTDATNETNGRKRRRIVSVPVVVAIAVLIVLAVGTGVFFALNGPKGDLGAAKKALEAGDYAAAENEAAEVVAHAEDDIDARKVLADALVGQGKNDEAIKQYTQIVKAAPKDDEALYDLAILERQAGNPQDALKHLQTAADITGSVEYLDEYARTCMQVSKFDEAIAAWRTVLESSELSPQVRADTLGALAQAYQDARRYDEARQALVEALTLLPDDPNLKARLESLGG